MREDDKNMVVGIESGNATVTPRAGLENLYLMPVKEQTLTIADGSKLDGNCLVWKSQQGKATISAQGMTAGRVIVSEGELNIQDTELKTLVDLRARGTLSGNGKVRSISFEGALNNEGCRIKPMPLITIKDNMVIDKKVYVETDIDNGGLVEVEGNVSLSSQLVFTVKSSNCNPGKYTLLKYNGTFEGEVSDIKLEGLVGLAYSVSNVEESNGGRIELTIESQRSPYDYIYWNGGNSDTWDYQTANWESENGGELKFVAGDGVVFGNKSQNTQITVNELMPVKSVTFESNQSFTVNGEGGFSGKADLTKNGEGKLTMNVTKSDYEGNTIVNGGTMEVKEMADKGLASSIGTGNAGTLQIGKATFIVNNSNTSTDREIILIGDTASISVPKGTVSFKGKVSGNGILRKTGTGQLNITYAGSNTWSETVLQSGTLAMGAWNTTFGKASSPIHVTGNAAISMFDNNSTSAVPSFANILTVDKGKKLTFKAGSRCKVQGQLSGEGTFSISFPYVRGDFHTDCSGFNGTFEVTSGQFRLRKALDLKNATLKLGSGVYAAGFSSDKTEGSFTHYIGALISAASDAQLSTGIWNVGYLGTKDTFAGIFNASATLNKYGEGTMTLTGASSGKLNIHEGEILANTTSAATTTGLITVYDGALLNGTGKVKNVNVQGGGTIGSGKTTMSTVSSLTVEGNLTVEKGGVIRVRTRSSATASTCDALNVSGSISLTSPKFVFKELSNSNSVSENAVLKVFKGNGSISLKGEPTFEPAVPGDGLVWDWSELESNGTIKVISDLTGIESISMDEVADKVVYDLRGCRLSKVTTPGLYIVNNKKVKIEK